MPTFLIPDFGSFVTTTVIVIKGAASFGHAVIIGSLSNIGSLVLVITTSWQGALEVILGGNDATSINFGSMLSLPKRLSGTFLSRNFSILLAISLNELTPKA